MPGNSEAGSLLSKARVHAASYRASLLDPEGPIGAYARTRGWRWQCVEYGDVRLDKAAGATSPTRGPSAQVAPSRALLASLTDPADGRLLHQLFLPDCDPEGSFLWGGIWGFLPFLRAVGSMKPGEPGPILSAREIFNQWLEFQGDIPNQGASWFAKNLYWLLLGGGRSTGWLQLEDHPSPWSRTVARTQVRTVQITRSGLKQQTGWGWPRRIVGTSAAALCRLHTPDGSAAGLVRYLGWPDQPDQIARGLAVRSIPYHEHDEPRRVLLACSALSHAQPLANAEPPRVHTRVGEELGRAVGSPPGTNLLTAFVFAAGDNFEDALVISESAARKLALGRTTTLSLGVSWLTRPREVARIHAELNGGAADRINVSRAEEWRLPVDFGAAAVDREDLPPELQSRGFDGVLNQAMFGRRPRWPAHLTRAHWTDAQEVQRRGRDQGLLAPPYRGWFDLELAERFRACQPGDKLANRHGNKGVVARVVPDDQMPRIEDPRSPGTWPFAEVLANPIGVLNRGNFGQLAEAIASWSCSDGAQLCSDDLPLDQLRGEVARLGTLDPSGRSQVKMKDGRIIRAVAGWNFWLRSEHEAVAQARVAEHPAGAVVRELRRPSSMAMRGVTYGERNAWALAVRPGFGVWRTEDLAADRRLGPDDYEDRLQGWRRLVLLATGAEPRGPGDKRLSLKVAHTRTGSVSQLTNPKEFTPWLERQTGLKKRHDRLAIQAPQATATRPNPSTGASGWLEKLGEALLADRWTLRKQLEPSTSRSGIEGLSRSPFVRWPLRRPVRPSARLVIVPDAELALDELRLPWWLVLQFFWPRLRPETRERWSAWGRSLPREALTETIESLDPAAARPEANWIHELNEELEDLGLGWSVIHRDPVIHWGSVWPLRTRADWSSSPVAGLPLGLLGPMGADFDGDCVSVVPVLSQRAGLEFCRPNAPLTPDDGVYKAPISGRMPFPLSKDIRAAATQSALDEEAFLSDGQASRSALDGLDGLGEVVGLGWDLPAGVSGTGLRELLEAEAVKRDHLPQAGEHAGEIPSKGWWTVAWLDSAVRAFFEAKRGAARVGGMYRTHAWRIPGRAAGRQPEETVAMLIALQGLMEPLQQAVLSFKGRQTILDGQAVCRAWQRFVEQGRDALDNTAEHRRVREILDSDDSQPFLRVLGEDASGLPCLRGEGPLARFWGRFEAPRGPLPLPTEDPRLALLPAGWNLEPARRWAFPTGVPEVTPEEEDEDDEDDDNDDNGDDADAS